MKHTISLTEFGFLFAIFTAPWGPVIRYIGWLFAIVGLALDFKRGSSFRMVLDPWISCPLVLFVLSALFSTSIHQSDLALWGKGVSMVLEFAFAIWLAAYVFQIPFALERWKRVWLAGIILSLLHYFAGELSILPKLLFSNINTTGIYACIIVPFVFALYFESRRKGKELLHSVLFFICLFLLLSSFTSSAWIGGSFALFVQLIVTPVPMRKIKILALLLPFFIVLSGLVLRSGIYMQGNDIMAMFSREVNQLFSFDDLSRLTNHRIHIWRGSWEMFKTRPLLGWGWGDFIQIFADFHRSTWDEAATGLNLKIYSAHSMYLNLAVQGGLPAVIIVIWIYTRCAFNAFKQCRLKVQHRFLHCAIFALVAGQFVYGLGGDVFSFRNKGAILFWTLLGLAGMRNGPSGEEVFQDSQKTG